MEGEKTDGLVQSTAKSLDQLDSAGVWVSSVGDELYVGMHRNN